MGANIVGAFVIVFFVGAAVWVVQTLRAEKRRRQAAEKWRPSFEPDPPMRRTERPTPRYPSTPSYVSKKPVRVIPRPHVPDSTREEDERRRRRNEDDGLASPLNFMSPLNPISPLSPLHSGSDPAPCAPTAEAPCAPAEVSAPAHSCASPSSCSAPSSCGGSGGGD